MGCEYWLSCRFSLCKYFFKNYFPMQRWVDIIWRGLSMSSRYLLTKYFSKLVSGKYFLESGRAKYFWSTILQIFSYLLHIVLSYRRHRHLLHLPLLLLPGLDEDIVHVHAVVILLWLSPLDIQTTVSRTSEISDESSETGSFKGCWFSCLWYHFSFVCSA